MIVQLLLAGFLLVLCTWLMRLGSGWFLLLTVPMFGISLTAYAINMVAVFGQRPLDEFWTRIVLAVCLGVGLLLSWRPRWKARDDQWWLTAPIEELIDGE